MDRYSCNLCDKSFKHEVSLKRHNRAKHGNFRVFCDICNASTTTKSALIRHMNTQHKSPLQTVKFTIQCPLCSENKSKTLEILQHYTSEHNIVIVVEDMEFPNENEFETWKKGIEKEQMCEFVCKNLYKRKASEEKRILYRCHRDGHFKSRSKAARLSKILGTNKINGHCPAKMDVIQCPSGKVKVSFLKTHVGHQGELGRLRLPRTVKDEIAVKVALKIPFGDILASMRASVCKDNVQRAELVTRKDLHNIARDYKLKAETVKCRNDFKNVQPLHDNDCTSVESCVMETQGAVSVEESNAIVQELRNQDIKEKKAEILRHVLSILNKARTSDDFATIDQHLSPILPTIEARKSTSCISAPADEEHVFEGPEKRFSLNAKIKEEAVCSGNNTKY